MYDDRNRIEPLLIKEIEHPVRFIEIQGKDGIAFNPKFTRERRIRLYTYELLKCAKNLLPNHLHFVVYEAFRPRAFQIQLWNSIVEQMKKENPQMDATSEDFLAMCDVYAANPYRQGSGHQSGGAVDITLADKSGGELDMGSLVRDFSKNASSENKELPEHVLENRRILNTVMSSVGFVNYPPEWWHYSFGDRLWAALTGSKLAFFGSVDN